MQSRAYLLLQRDFCDIKENNYKSITARPVSEDMMEWEVEIEGLQNSVWQGLVFQLTIHFTSEYSYALLVVKFVTIPFHPNVDPHTGQPCIDFLDNPKKWNTNYTLSSILLALQVVLSNPVPENPVNLEAARILVKDESLYRTILKLFNRPLQMLKDPDFIGQYYKWKKMDLQHHKEWNLKYSVIKCWLARKNRMPHEVNHSMEEIKLCPTLNEIFLESPTAINSITDIYETEEEGWKSDTSLCENDTDEPREEEVEDLISWTNTLNTNTLED
ncbi:ubiquitin-conjugating enzyme E2 U [Symphalangus syndactylus]|uniref:ubiquitin-conjugating enzyme E2 U n=1 Tax=Symphalangus syndactylus TaxID=9590 RepID=UPI002440FEDA|nr:ubiquitin-conjugating enzyme E2 U [Symphalangus syndactylus]